MGSFFENGVALQDAAYEKEYAAKKYAQSCAICSRSNLNIGCFDCDHCPITAAHERALKRIAEKANDKTPPVENRTANAPKEDAGILGLLANRVSTRLFNALRRLDVSTMDELVNITEENLRSIRGIGKGSWNELQDTIQHIALVRKASGDVKDLRLPEYLLRRLADENITSIGELEAMPDEDLRKIRRMGAKSVTKIRDAIREYVTQQTPVEEMPTEEESKKYNRTLTVTVSKSDYTEAEWKILSILLRRGKVHKKDESC